MKRRILAVLLALVLVLPAVAVRSDADEQIVIAWNEPAIPADAGTAVDLSAYSVQFASGEAASAYVDWMYEGRPISAFTPPSEGVYKLTADDGSGTAKDVYVVAKKPEDTEYVLYFNGFDSADSLEGFTLSTTASRFTVSGSDLVIDATGMDMARVTLPEWLGVFGNYCITARVTSTDEKDNNRWNSICYRAKGSSYPFYQMCVRKNCGSGSGVEFALRTPANGWDVQESGVHTKNQVTGTYYVYKVQAKDNVIIHSIDGNDIIYTDSKKTYQSGCIGLIANYSKMHVDYIKVTLQLGTPQIKVARSLIIPSATVENITNAFANVAEPANAASLEAVSDAHSVILGTDGTDVFGTDGSRICALSDVLDVIGDTVIPAFRCDTKAAADGVVQLVKKQLTPDAIVLSADPEVLKYARSKQPLLRGVIDLRGKYDHVMTYEDVVEARVLINGSNVKTGLFDAVALDAAAAEEMRSMLLTVWAYTPADTDPDVFHAMLVGAHAVASPAPQKVKAAYSLFAEDALTRTPVIIGHRGNPTNAPENSISSYRLGYQNGADVVETDVYLSKDGEVVVMHDSDISRTTTGSGNIESLTLAQLKQYNLWGENNSFKSKFPDEKIPTLREIFELMQECEGLKLFVEIKTGKTAVCQKIADLAKEYGMMERISVISFSLDQLTAMHSVAPEISCGYLMSAPSGSASPELAANALNAYIANSSGKNNTINPSYSGITYNFISAANARGITVWPWTYNTGSADKFAYAFKTGYNGLTTNDAQYTKNNVKYIYAPQTVEMLSGDTARVPVTAYNYGRTEKDVTDKAQVTVISGDCISVSDGVITGIKEGVAYVVCSYSTKLSGVSAGTYTVYTDVVKIEVHPAVAEGEVVFSSSSGYKIENGVVTVDRLGTLVSELESGILNSGVGVYEGMIKSKGSRALFTGLLLRNENGDRLAAIAVRGDADGNGDCDSDDVEAAKDILLGISKAGRAYTAACDMDGDGTYNVSDYITLRLRTLES